MTKRLLTILLLLLLTGTSAAPAAAKPGAPNEPGSKPPVDAGTRIGITFVSDVRDNGESTWFDAFGRPRTQTNTPLTDSVGGGTMWTSTLLYTTRATTRVTATFTTGGSFARCVILVDEQVRVTDTATTRGGRAECTA
jgi:hypothetical protein